jgi:hypothetical protein
MSIPTAGPGFGADSGISISHWIGTYHQSASRLTVGVFISPFSGRCLARAAQPAFGRKRRARSAWRLQSASDVLGGGATLVHLPFATLTLV